MATPALHTLTPAQFIARWQDAGFGERAGAQSFFNDLCALVGHPTPAAYGNPDAYTFEKSVPGGFADAYLEERFGWEFKGRDAQLDSAFNQLLRYQVYLKTPPLLIVSSFQTIRIRTNFPGMETILHEIPVAGLDEPANLELLRNVFFAPDALRPERSIEQVTEETALLFRDIVTDLERHSAADRNGDPERLARHLNRIVFCLYAEDAGLLPNAPFANILHQHTRRPDLANRAINGLFEQMAGGGMFGADAIPHFNGDLFSAADPMELSAAALQRLGEAAGKNWRNIDPSIFGTLFERALDASKRAQTGAHYTGADDIMLVVDPVVMQPLRREWDAARQEIDGLLADADDSDGAKARLEQFRRRLASVTVLDPACGSGNFLYIALRALLDLEKQVIDYAVAQGWDNLTPTVKPDQMLGLEINHYAAELARTALWIGYIQWHQNNGFPYTQEPILTPRNTIRLTDAILDLSDADNPAETTWPAAEFIVGNPPFLGNKMMRRGVGDAIVDSIYAVYSNRLPRGSDLCCYWLEKARAQIADNKSKRAGLLGTQGIRGGANRRVLQRIKESGDIFMAYPDREWVLDGAMVHISIVGFDDGSEKERLFDGVISDASINANLTVGVDLTSVRQLPENAGIAFQGFNRVGNFDVDPDTAIDMLNAPNPHGKPNSDVLKPYRNARDFLDKPRGVYTVDFGVAMSEYDAALYELPFEFIRAGVKPERERNRNRRAREMWWLYQLPGIELRKALDGLERYIATGRVSKHRIFAWLDGAIMPDSALVIFARTDDYTLGVLHSRIHELWARALGTQLREAESGFRYTPTTCFETFPFPQPTDGQRDAIAAVAVELNWLRENWLNPVVEDGSSEVNAAELRRRTLTNLYNQRPSWLANAHSVLDAAVADAYGWPTDLGDAAVLERLLELNLGRAAV